MRGLSQAEPQILLTCDDKHGAANCSEHHVQPRLKMFKWRTVIELFHNFPNTFLKLS